MEYPKSDAPTIVEFFFFGYDGKVLTKAEYDERVAAAQAEAERERLWRLENPDYGYDW